jgi:hypothetical protein
MWRVGGEFLVLLQQSESLEALEPWGQSGSPQPFLSRSTSATYRFAAAVAVGDLQEGRGK